MYHQSKAVVLYASKYPRGYVVHLYTREMGRLACVVNDVKSRRSPLRKVLLQPLSVVDVTLEMGASNALPRLREGSVAVVYDSVPYDFRKNAVALFLAEFLSLVLRDAQQDEALFDFVESSLVFFDKNDASPANFHIAFLLQLARFVGFEPNMDDAHLEFFDFQEAHFTALRPLHRHFLESTECAVFVKLMRMNYRNMHRFAFAHGERIEVLNRIVEYYQLHFGNFSALRSLAVLQEVFA